MNLAAAHERHLVLRADRRVLDASLELEQQSIDAGHMAVAVANGERDEEVLHARERATLVRHAMNVLFNPIRNAATAVAERVMTGREFGGAETSTEPPLYPGMPGCFGRWTRAGSPQKRGRSSGRKRSGA